MVGIGRQPAVIGPSRGDIHLVDLAPTGGHVMRGPHPCVIVQSDRLARSQTKVVVPMTSSERIGALDLPFVIPVSARESGLDRDGWAKCDQPITVAVDLLGPRLGRLSPASVERVGIALRFVLAI
jgi:mRNA interferase MazF